MSEVNIYITGDLYVGQNLVDLDLVKETPNLFHEFKKITDDANFVITNLEAPITNNSQYIKKTGPNLKSPHEIINLIKYLGIDCLCLANNHIMDYGIQGLNDTINLLKENGLEYIGVGDNLKMHLNSKIILLNNIKVGFLNISENEWSTVSSHNSNVHYLDPVINFYQILEAKAKCDYLFLIYHGGVEYLNLPTLRIKSLFRFFIDVGVDCVISHHTHVISGSEIYKGKHIFYGIGNFIFDREKYSEKELRGLIVKIRVSKGGLSFEQIPFMQFGLKRKFTILTGQAKNDCFDHLKSLNQKICDDNMLDREFELFVNKKMKMYKWFLEPHSNSILYFLQSKGLIPSFYSDRKKRLLTNLIRCESHREIILKILTSEL